MNNKKYKITIDYEVKVWERMSGEIKANSLQEAKDKMKNFLDGVEEEPCDIEYETLHDTEQRLNDDVIFEEKLNYEINE